MIIFLLNTFLKTYRQFTLLLYVADLLINVIMSVINCKWIVFLRNNPARSVSNLYPEGNEGWCREGGCGARPQAKGFTSRLKVTPYIVHRRKL